MKGLLDLFKQFTPDEHFDAIRIGLASPEKIRSWSFGEVKKPETINYRTFKPERDGLFCAKIFGPIKDYECLCGKYKRLKHRGVICEKCGVEVTQTKVRRERMGHIELAAPCAHIWFLKSLPSRLGLVLDMTLRDIERVLYFEAYVVVDPGMTPLKKYSIMSEDDYESKRAEYGDEFVAMMGAEGIKKLLEDMDIDAEIEKLRNDMTGSELKIKKNSKRLKVLEAFKKSGIKPQWMIMEVLPVLPPDLRPLVPLDGGRFATSDLNDLYRRVINRNNRLARLLELKAPEIIVRNEKRMLQEAVDSLLDNGRRGKAMTGANKRALKSLADMIKGKSGRFRQNLLGKRVDYSGRSVITVGPTLKLHQCGLPKLMALELFKPFIFSKLEQMGIATTIKAAKKEVEAQTPVVWDILEEVIKEHPVLLNRAPTLHRLGIQAFEPVLIEGKAIQLHPLVCAAFNADFDGDQMAVHVPLSLEAQMEARALMLASNNVLFPANGEPSIVPSQDVVLGLYYATRERINGKGEGMVFADVAEVQRALDNGVVELTAKISVRLTEYAKDKATGQFIPETKLVETTAGRALLSEILPKGLPFALINKALKKKEISKLINASFRRCGLKETVVFADKLLQSGFRLATRAGISIAIDDMLVPREKQVLIERAEQEVKEIQQQYVSGLVTAGERYNKVVDIWGKTSDEVGKVMMAQLAKEKVVDRHGKEVEQESFNSIYMMADSGARGSAAQIRQLAGMRGLMAKPDGSIIETPITANFREGLNVLQYFNSTHGARKGLADTALKTANSGYLTRRLVDVTQDLVVTEEDCGTEHGFAMRALVEGGEVIESLRDRILGRVAATEVLHPETQEVIIPAGTMLDEDALDLIEQAGVDEVKVRTPLTCNTRFGLCAKCYGRDLGRGGLVNVGEAVGVIAAQSIGEPGTQLTMRTFHIGGAATRAAVASSVEAKSDGIIGFNATMRYVTNGKGELVVIARSGEIIISDPHGRERERHKVPYGATLNVKADQQVKAGTILANWDPLTRPIITEFAGRAKFENVEEGVTVAKQVDEVTGLSTLVVIDPKRRGAAKVVRPQVKLVDAQGNEVKIPGTDHSVTIGFPVGALIQVRDGQELAPGEVLARIPVEGQKTRDITGGLPRVAELFEARSPKDKGILAEVTGTVSFGKETKGKVRLQITDPDGKVWEELVPKEKNILVHEGQVVNKGELIVDGPADPQDILRLLGIEELARYIVDEVQDVYRLQGVKINDKHIEVIVRQMLRRVQIVNPGDSHYIAGEQVERSELFDTNDKLRAEGKVPATYSDVLLGITKASLSTDSFISAASFQETTRVLTEAAIMGKRDELRGLKENVIVGRLIPAGTGLAYHQARKAKEEMDEQERRAIAMQEAEEMAALQLAQADSDDESNPPAGE
ncbi:DNA-directed RNA polymerase subunit beta' [Caldimonas thermodepolymerans]|jgi:DNA-directed RNA polymerase, beta'' subunit, predominant form|uniref:DNA-directed RNA polymerase subunit beta' n=2 Tax=Caldimonas TaxID=196013 RepID=A0A2S5T083_9BURK|nr:DNA-directed RNA polymerase subunit beta' [Caldimonas thermodepolymerans]PPE68319.1 DNA-directed RNA polymerase subunit beta' [Caldimonas thermodepolymerans]QPC31198.1 DNA-directed RNA polymerase subunit beta' [Caldimonas thermodepolymerans]RDH96656.1 DNA-directed RNA polymerase subunit beta' [Caldimonas thermodepolymerans]TCP04745.1 DNA-directed RNA polymerase subunit beta' [Caldimonas thermodepolymerans]UZG43928.1 DNA-directed RNA polymerase subunit beta' [Caldimonas thermodepolymerans]